MEIIGLILAIAGLILAVVFWIFSPDWARKLFGMKEEDGDPHYKLIKRAQSGDAVAQYDLGIMYNFGDRVPLDHDLGFVWFSKAAEQNNLSAIHALGYSYEYGWGVDIDIEKAFEFYKKAAEQGHAGAQYSVGRAYFEALGVRPDNKKALIWLEKASEQGVLEADDLISTIAVLDEEDED